MAERAYDIVLFGATGFTGGLTAEYLAAHLPADARWALAGRNRAKLEAVRDRLGTAGKDVPLLHADSGDAGSLRRVAEAARVVISSVGPYLELGEPLVAACADAGTDYVDLTGEPEFVDRMYLAHHERAVATGARLVHACGFDSVPHDLGAYYTVRLLPVGVPLRVEGFVRASSSISGGTYHSALGVFSRLREGARAAAERRRAEGDLEGRRVRIAKGPSRFAPPSGAWAVPWPTLDPAVVTRSARALDRYGPDFSYGHYIALKRLVFVAGLVGGAGVLVAAANVPPARRQLLKLRAPGDGPDAARRERSWFNVRFVGEGGGVRVVTEVTGGDPGYGETAKMLAESAMCLAYDDLPPTAGQVTTATAMGDALIGRLVAAGISFRTLKETGV